MNRQRSQLIASVAGSCHEIVNELQNECATLKLTRIDPKLQIVATYALLCGLVGLAILRNCQARVFNRTFHAQRLPRGQHVALLIRNRPAVLPPPCGNSRK